jgi:hypothetical protein
MNLSLRLNTIATKAAIWTAKNAFASRLIMLALPVTFAVAAVIMRNPPCGATGGGTGGSC